MFQMFSRKSDIILKHLYSFLFEKNARLQSGAGLFFVD